MVNPEVEISPIRCREAVSHRLAMYIRDGATMKIAQRRGVGTHAQIARAVEVHVGRVVTSVGYVTSVCLTATLDYPGAIGRVHTRVEIERGDHAIDDIIRHLTDMRDQRDREQREISERRDRADLRAAQGVPRVGAQMPLCRCGRPVASMRSERCGPECEAMIRVEYPSDR